MFKEFGILTLLAITLNLAFWGGLIFFTLWCLKYFGVI